MDQDFSGEGVKRSQKSLSTLRGMPSKFTNASVVTKPIGVIEVQGQFERGDVVACINEAGNEVARGIVNYNSNEATRIMRKASAEIEKILGYVEESELIHRDNLIII